MTAKGKNKVPEIKENKITQNNSEEKLTSKKRNIKKTKSKDDSEKANKDNKLENIKKHSQNEKIYKDKTKDVEEDLIDNKEKNKEEKESVSLIKIEEIKKVFKKKIPKEDKKKLRKPILQNLMVAITIIVYLSLLILGFNNIDSLVYQTDLKVFAICILLFAIIILERAYKKDSGRIALLGIEIIFVAILTLALIYVNLMLTSNYINIILIISLIFILYYTIKCIIMYIKDKNKYYLKNMKEMINNEEE